jgi:hypothetical protein
LAALHREPLIHAHNADKDKDAPMDSTYSETHKTSTGEPPRSDRLFSATAVVDGEDDPSTTPTPAPEPTAAAPTINEAPSRRESTSAQAPAPGDEKGNKPRRGSYVGVKSHRGSVIGIIKDEFLSSLSWAAVHAAPTPTPDGPGDPTAPDLTFVGALEGEDKHWFIYPKQASMHRRQDGQARYSSLCLRPALPAAKQEVFWKVGR